MFAETSTVPDFDCQVDVLFAGKTYSAAASEGIWSMAVEAPASRVPFP